MSEEKKKSDKQKSDKQTLKEFANYEEANTALFNMCASASGLNDVDFSKTPEGIQALKKAKNNIDEFGKCLKQGTPCMVCGTTIHWGGLNGYCSTKCFLEDLMNRIKSMKTKPNDFDKIIDNLQRILDMLNMALNMIAELPQKLVDMVHLPQPYRNFIQIHVNLVFIQIRLIINKVMIFKNNLIIKLLEPIANGVLLDKLVEKYPILGQIINTIGALYVAFDTTYTLLLKLLQNPIFTIPAESYVWALTPRSVITQPGFLWVEVPKSAMLSDLVPLAGGLTGQYVEQIQKTIQGLFPPILPPEYLMPPEAFEYRLIFSNQSDLVMTIARMLQEYLKAGPEYMPRYKDLKLTNIFFLAGLLLGWGPTGRLMFGSFINPYA